jgi:rubrerythrin
MTMIDIPKEFLEMCDWGEGYYPEGLNRRDAFICWQLSELNKKLAANSDFTIRDALFAIAQHQQDTALVIQNIEEQLKRIADAMETRLKNEAILHEQTLNLIEKRYNKQQVSFSNPNDPAEYPIMETLQGWCRHCQQWVDLNAQGECPQCQTAIIRIPKKQIEEE